MKCLVMRAFGDVYQHLCGQITACYIQLYISLANYEAVGVSFYLNDAVGFGWPNYYSDSLTFVTTIGLP
jgi:hypothetical protein